MLTIKKFFGFVFIILLLGSCAVSPSALNDLQQEKNDLEIQGAQLRDELQTAKINKQQMEKEINDMNRLLNSYKQLINTQGEKKHAASNNGELQYTPDNSEIQQSSESEEVLKKQFLSMNSIESPEDLYSIAENLYNRQSYRYAILAFQKFINQYPRDPQVPSAHLMQGFSLIKIGKKQDARFFLTDVINKFPESIEAQKAGHKLAELK